MVRLEYSFHFVKVFHSSQFQFLNGAIRMWAYDSDWYAHDTFQFLNGAIRIFIPIFFFATAFTISIPQWCD